jgi:acetylornithine deacetylase
MNANPTALPSGASPAAIGPSPVARAMIERLIGFKTVSRDSNLGLIEYVRDYLQGYGATCRLTYDASGKKANLFATLGESGKRGLVLSGHSDVVPIDGQDWDTDPFVVSEREGKLYARGSADMKGFIGIMLAQALSYDEEVGCLGVRGLIRDLEENGIRPAGCIVGEPTSMQPIIAHKGMHRFRCTVRGREAHSSFVTFGVNAIEFAARMVVFIRQLADRLAQSEQRDYGFTVPYTTMSTGIIRGGIASNVIPKHCEFVFDLRTLPGATPEAVQQEIRDYAATLTREMQAVDPDSGIDLTWESQTVGLAATEADAIVQWAMQLSGNAKVGKVSYGTEAGLFQEMGVPTVICGPGDIAQAHRPYEFVALEQLGLCEAFMSGIVERGFKAI